MKNGYSWVSEYRRKKFLENHGEKNSSNQSNRSYEDLNLSLENLSPKRYKAIAIMLDLDGTSTDITDDVAEMFMEQLDTLRKKFQAEVCYISISTHYGDTADYKIRPVLNCLSRHLTEHIKIGDTFYYEGTYNYEENRFYPYCPNFNRDKIKTFTEHYLHRSDFDITWFALIDDNIDENAYRDYQDDRTMLIARPSSDTETTPLGNIMSISTTTKGFAGVLKLLASYISEIKYLTPNQILERQLKIEQILSKHALREKIIARDYAFLETYFCEGHAFPSDYEDTVKWLVYTNDNISLTLEELRHIEKILSHIAAYYRTHDHEITADHVIRLREIFRKTTTTK